jgi:hypothetical protein
LRCGPEKTEHLEMMTAGSAPASSLAATGLRAACSIVVHLWKEVAATFGRHIEESLKRIDKIAGAMMLLWSGRSKAHL